MNPTTPDDPREAGGGIVGPGGPHDRGQVTFDARHAVIVEGIEVAVAHVTHGGKQAEDAVALVINGRINRPPDDAIASEMPRENVSYLNMTSWEGVVDLICELQALAARGGVEIEPLLRKKWAELREQGLTRRRP